MSENLITGKQYALKDVFSSKFEYRIPEYQRPYAWTTEEAGTLLSDLVESFEDEDERVYFLGSVVLAKEEGSPLADVIDGQQRLITLTILIAVIADLLDDESYRASMLKYLNEPGDPVEGIRARPRVHPRERDRAFFEKYVQGLDLGALAGLGLSSFGDEAQANVARNAKALADGLKAQIDGPSFDLREFASFLMVKCILVVVATRDRESAYRVFSVMNSRGLDLLPTDIIKVDVIDALPESDRRECAAKWEELGVSGI